MFPKTRFYRFLEMIPGTLIWGTLATAIALAFFRPIWALYFVIVFDLYWLFRVIYFIFNLYISWRQYQTDTRINWFERLKGEQPEWTKIRHLIFLPTYKEGIEVLRTTLSALSRVDYPKDKFIIVLAGEERDKENFLRCAADAAAEFKGIFGEFLITLHPRGLPDEIPGKGSNLHWAGWKAKAAVDRLGIPYENIMASLFDVDTVTHPQYFAYLTYKYLTVKDPQRASYQPIPLYNNNMWVSPALIRVAAWGTTFWLMTELPRRERLFTFSSHSMPFKALTDVGFWEKDIVTEDTRIFLQAYLHYDGNYRVEPLFIPVSMDTVMTNRYAESLKALYVQQRRWAWGIEHFPYLFTHFLRKKKMSIWKKNKIIWYVLEGMYSWATAPLLIFILGQLPFWVGAEQVGSTVLFQSTPVILQWIMTAAMAGIVVSALLMTRLLPPIPSGTPRLRRLHMLWQWLLLPFSLIIFGAIPAIDAQTRLMLGKYLGFNVTKKTRVGVGARGTFSSGEIQPTPLLR